ncbi:hypothetical protein D3C81_1125610 [compost metagenome]
MVVGQYLGIVGEDRAVLWILDMLFQRHETLATRLVEQFVQQAEHVQVVLALVLRALERTDHGPERLLDGLEWCADQERAQRSAANDDQLVGLPERSQPAVGADVTAEHTEDDDKQADEDEHGAGTTEGDIPLSALAPASEV